MGKKAASVAIVTLLLLFTAGGYAFAAGFSDLQGHWAAGQINKWVEQGLVAGYEDGTFKPDRQITRAEFVALVNRSFAVEPAASGLRFADVQPGTWYYGEVAAAAAAGYISGYPDGSFGPGLSITRQEAAAILVRLLKLAPAAGELDQIKDAGLIAQWAHGSVGAVVRDGLMVGMPDHTFQPQKNISRAEAVVSLERALEFTPPVQETGIEGQAVYKNAAVQNAVVRVYAAGGYEVLEIAKTDTGGTFKLDLEPGSYDLTAVTDQEVAYRSDVQVYEDQVTVVNLELQAAAVLTGELKDKDGNPVKNATLTFTTNPTFITSTNVNGQYSVALVPDRNYLVRFVSGEEGSETVKIEDNLSVGHAGPHNVPLATETSAEQPAAGGGGGAGGGGADEAPVVESVTFVVDGSPVTVTGANNSFNINLTGGSYTDASKFTEITVNASSDADKARLSLLGVTKTITFNQGVASVSVDELVGEQDISLGGLKTILSLLGTSQISITVTGKTGLTSEVNVTIDV
ncbi:Endo-1,4-beta-xylanase A precursor [Pelotomaculum schinkii]|uniref:Endo-1,4-beta-xylanase A n=1 Tax=Pelotomaculum schinkii TaxID=78350 RepID=A0A4Y7RI35_9FIRM|nr:MULTISPECIES: S-layer homology domain-containing protein [Pelotomaculum]TEB08362.1 Endo-1,4-beta-xylanase A precursor [Pelotomaculum schinkii]TEB17242.1 Endo-1,4-beta-xylanase A precursor [Pelotomaculum sp. FP]